MRSQPAAATVECRYVSRVFPTGRPVSVCAPGVATAARPDLAAFTHGGVRAEPFLFVADATDTQLEHPPSPSLAPRRSVIFPAGSPFRQPVFNLDTRRFGQIDELQPHSIFARGPTGPTDPPFRFEVLPQRARHKTICGQLRAGNKPSEESQAALKPVRRG